MSEYVTPKQSDKVTILDDNWLLQASAFSATPSLHSSQDADYKADSIDNIVCRTTTTKHLIVRIILDIERDKRVCNSIIYRV